MVIKVGADGYVNAQTVSLTRQCCEGDLCSIDPCELICNFVNLLPNGPLWDQPKQQALKYYQEPTCIDDVLVPDCLYKRELCSSIVVHSVYTALRLYDLLLNALWPTLYESDPFTAYDTMDDWLDKLGWRNCFEAGCRDSDLGALTPIEIQTTCGNEVCALDYPPCLILTIKHLTLIALSRLQMGIVSNLASINWVIEPLGAVIAPIPELDYMCPLQYSISPLVDEFETWSRPNCIKTSPEYCQAWFDPNSCQQTGLPSKIYPGLMVAECIARSVMPRCNSIEITRLCEVIT